MDEWDALLSFLLLVGAGIVTIIAYKVINSRGKKVPNRNTPNLQTPESDQIYQSPISPEQLNSPAQYGTSPVVIREKQQNEYSQTAKEHDERQKQKDLQLLDEKMKRLKLGEYRLGKGARLGGMESPLETQTGSPDKRTQFVESQQEMIHNFAKQLKLEEDMEIERKKGLQEIHRENEKQQEAIRRQHEEARKKQQAIMDNKAKSFQKEKTSRELDSLEKKTRDLKLQAQKIQSELAYKEEEYFPVNSLSEDRLIMEQQEREFQESLRMDEEKELARIMEEQLQLEKERRIRNLMESRISKGTSIPSEPRAEAIDVFTAILKLPGGRRYSRRFSTLFAKKLD